MKRPPLRYRIAQNVVAAAIAWSIVAAFILMGLGAITLWGWVR